MTTATRAIIAPACLSILFAAPAIGQELPYTLASPHGQLFGSFGLAVAGAGDVNGDGLADVIVGADGEAGEFGNVAGRAYVFDGPTGHLRHTLQAPQHVSGNYFGTAVAGIGDVDGDGGSDVLVGARAADNPGGAPAGLAFIFSGTDGVLLHTLASPNAEAGGSFGSAVAAAGDVDGDGVPDAIVGAAGENAPVGHDAGRAYVFSGATGAVLRVLESPSAMGAALFGESVAGVGDMDGDGLSDLLVGAVNEHAGDGLRGGRAHLFSGATGEAIRSLDSPFAQASGRFGLAVAGAGDVDGDGVPDVLIGAPGEQPAGANSGRAYLFSGASGLLLHAIVSPNVEETGFFGSAVSGAGDLDGDGLADVLLGGGGEDTAGGFGAGRAYAFRGVNGSLLFTLESPNGQAGGVFGLALASAGDVDGDGRPEIAVGAMGESTTAGNAAGRAYVMPAPTVVAAIPVAGESGLAVEVAPNPSRDVVVVRFSLPADGQVRVSVVDILGREIARPVDEARAAGSHSVVIPNLPAGVYVARLVAGAAARTERFTVSR